MSRRRISNYHSWENHYYYPLLRTLLYYNKSKGMCGLYEVTSKEEEGVREHLHKRVNRLREYMPPNTRYLY